MKKQDRQMQKIQKKFVLWRKSKPVNAEIPERLWKCVEELCEDYSPSVVRRCLNINWYAFQKRFGDRFKKQHKVPKQDNFVTLPMSTIVASEGCSSIIEWVRPDGSQMRASLSNGQLELALRTFLGGLQ